jgi:hypothetical protein
MDWAYKSQIIANIVKLFRYLFSKANLETEVSVALHEAFALQPCGLFDVELQ